MPTKQSENLDDKPSERDFDLYERWTTKYQSVVKISQATGIHVRQVAEAVHRVHDWYLKTGEYERRRKRVEELEKKMDEALAKHKQARKLTSKKKN